MSVNLCSNLQTNSRIAFSSNDNKKSYIGSAVKGAIVGAVAGAGYNYYRAKNTTIAGSEKTISAESLDSKKVKDYLSKLNSPIKCQASKIVLNAQESLINENASFSAAVGVATKKLVGTTKNIKNRLPDEYHEAKKELKITLAEGKEKLKRVKVFAFSAVKDYLPKDNHLSKRAGISAVVGAAALMLIHSVYGKEKHTFENLKPIS